MVTAEGRTLTEVTLQVRNRAQPFMKISLPTGATLASVEVAGQPAKPVLGTDGTRIPLLRPGFRPTGPYQVSFVYLLGGTPLAKRGDLQMLLPKMDLPVAIVNWEVFVPDRYTVTLVAGNVIDQRAVAESVQAGARNNESLPSAAPIEAPSERKAETGAERLGPGGDGGVAGGVAASVRSLEETVTVTARSVSGTKAIDEQRLPPSQNVLNLQRRAAGVLPIRIEIPKAGASHRFVKPLVIDQETTVTLRYKRR